MTLFSYQFTYYVPPVIDIFLKIKRESTTVDGNALGLRYLVLTI